MSNNKVIVYRAVSIIERDALLSHLHDLEIEATSGDRDLSRKYTETSLDLSYEGYSATMGGFPIFADEKKVKEAKLVIQEFLEGLKNSDLETTTTHYLDRFYTTALFTVVLPFLTPIALWHLYRGLSGGEKIRKFWFTCSILFIGLGLLLGYLFVTEVGWKFLLPRGMSYFEM